MKDLMLLLSDVMPEDMIITMLEETISEHKIAPTSESRGKISMLCMMFVAKEAASKTPGGIDGLMKQTDEMEAARKFYPKPKN